MRSPEASSAFPSSPASARYAIFADAYRTRIQRELTFYHTPVEKSLRIVTVKVGGGFCIISAT